MRLFTIATLCLMSGPLVAQVGAQQPDPVKGFLEQFDRDNSGSVSLAEFKEPQVKGIEQQFAFMDKNHDGGIDSAEVEAFIQEMRRQRDRIQQQRNQGESDYRR